MGLSEFTGRDSGVEDKSYNPKIVKPDGSFITLESLQELKYIRGLNVSEEDLKFITNKTSISYIEWNEYLGYKYFKWV